MILIDFFEFFGLLLNFVFGLTLYLFFELDNSLIELFFVIVLFGSFDLLFLLLVFVIKGNFISFEDYTELNFFVEILFFISVF